MAMIYQASAGVANAKKMTISMWCRAHTTNAPSDNGDYFSLVEFGNPNGGGNAVSGGVWLRTNTDGTNPLVKNQIKCKFAAVRDSVDGVDICTLVGSSNPPGYSTIYTPKMPPVNTTSTNGALVYDSTTNSGAGGTKFTPSLEGRANISSSAVDSEKWFHLLIAADATNTVSLGGAVNKLRISINGSAPDLIGPQELGDLWTNGDMQQMYYDSSGSSDVGPGRVASNFGGDAWIVVPGFEFDLNGFEIGVPSQLASPNKNTQLLDMAEVQIWVDKYIDPTNATNFSKLVDVHENGHGTPVNPDIAADYFGPQTYLFKGTREDFLTNQGSGGAFSYSGTITDSSGVAY